jgi:hypothetical protein
MKAKVQFFSTFENKMITAKKEEFELEGVKEKGRNEKEKKTYREKQRDSTLALRTLPKSRKGHVLLNARRRRTCPWSTE